MSDGWRFGLLIGGLGLSLLFIAIALLQIGSLRSEVDRLQQQVTEISQVRGDLDRIDNRFRELEEEQRWIVNRDWSVNGDRVPPGCEGDIPVEATWTFREIEPNANVFIEFRAGDSGDWERFDATPVSEVDYRAEALLDPSAEWQYRIISESNDTVRTSERGHFVEFHDLILRDPIIEPGEATSDDGERWFRFVIFNRSQRVSPCNEIVDAEIEVFADGELVETVALEQEYPGEYLPESDDADQQAQEAGSEGQGTAEARDTAPPGPADPAHAWWSDWIQMGDDVEVFANLEFADGTELRIDERGIY